MLFSYLLLRFSTPLFFILLPNFFKKKPLLMFLRSSLLCLKSISSFRKKRARCFKLLWFLLFFTSFSQVLFCCFLAKLFGLAWTGTRSSIVSEISIISQLFWPSACGVSKFILDVPSLASSSALLLPSKIHSMCFPNLDSRALIFCLQFSACLLSKRSFSFMWLGTCIASRILFGSCVFLRFIISFNLRSCSGVFCQRMYLHLRPSTGANFRSKRRVQI